MNLARSLDARWNTKSNSMSIYEQKINKKQNNSTTVRWGKDKLSHRWHGVKQISIFKEREPWPLTSRCIHTSLPKALQLSKREVEQSFEKKASSWPRSRKAVLNRTQTSHRVFKKDKQSYVNIKNVHQKNGMKRVKTQAIQWETVSVIQKSNERFRSTICKEFLHII